MSTAVSLEYAEKVPSAANLFQESSEVSYV